MYVYSVQSRVFKRMNVCNIHNRNSKSEKKTEQDRRDIANASLMQY